MKPTLLHEYTRLATTFSTKLPPRQLHTAVVNNHQLYIFGGYDDANQSQVYNDLHVFDFEDKIWRQVTVSIVCPVGRFAHSAVEYGEAMYVYGGAALGGLVFEDMWKFDFNEEKWEIVVTKGERPPPTWSHTAVVYGKQMWIFGGFDTSWSDKLYSFDFVSKKWLEFKGEPRPSPRQFHSAVVHGGSMYIYGGATNSDCSDLWKFSFSRKKWKLVANDFVWRKGHQMVVIDNTLVLFGGKNNKRFCSDFHFFDLKSKKWAPPSPINSKIEPRYFHSMVQWKGEIFIQGGKGQKECFKNQYQIRFHNHEIETTSHFSNLPPEVLNLIHENLSGKDLLSFNSTSYENYRRVYDLQWKRVLEEIGKQSKLLKSLYEEFLSTWAALTLDEQIFPESRFWKQCLQHYVVALKRPQMGYYLPKLEISEEFIQKQLKQKSGYLKLLLLGTVGVGKTHCVIQYVQGIFVENNDPYYEDSFRKEIEYHGMGMTLEILDINGIEQFQVMRDHCIKNSDVIIIMYSITSAQSFNLSREYYDPIVIVRDCESPPVILVGNKDDLDENREVTFGEGMALAKRWNCPFFETSAKNQHNIKEMFQYSVDVFASKQSDTPVSGPSCLVM